MPTRAENKQTLETAGCRAAADVKSCIRDAMDREGVTEQQLADRLQMSVKNLKKMLSPESRNISVKKVGEIFSALGTQVYFYLYPKTPNS